MNEILSKEMNILLLSADSAGVTSLIHRMLHNSFVENLDVKQQIYSYKMLTSEGLITLNFIDIQKQNRMKALDSINYQNKTIVIFVYSIDSLESLKSIGRLYEEVKKCIKDCFKNIKVGIIANKLDLINEKNFKNLKKKGEQFSEKINAKILFTSAKTGKGDPLQFILYLLNLKLKNEIIPNKNSVIKEYIKAFKNSKFNGNIVRCFQCKIKLGTIKFHETANKIEFYCKNHPKQIIVIDYEDYNSMSQNPKKCKICNKKFQEKNIEYLLYCKPCEDFICNNCIKKHEHNTEEEITYPYYIGDQLCDVHRIKNDIYCLNCNQLICNFCYNNSHLQHKRKILNNDYIDKITKEKYKLIEEQRQQLEIINKYYTDIIEELKSIYTDYINKKNLELQLKENILEHFKVIKYNNELFNSVLNMKFDGIKKIYNNHSLSITEKLTTLFNYFEQPINITNYNLCSNIKSEGEEKESIKTFKFTDDITNGNNYITDVCKIYNEYYGISFNNGNIKIYNSNDMANHLKICKLFDEGRGVNSMINYNNKNIILASGYEKIYQLTINKDLNLNTESIINHQNLDILKLCKYELNNSFLYSDNIGNIHIYNINDRKDSLINITSGNIIGTILDFKNISDNIFYIKYKEMDLDIDIEITRDTINETIVDRANSSTKEVNKIFYLHKSNEIYNEYIFNENIKILGVINKEYLIIQEDNNIDKIQYKMYDFKNKREINFGNLLIGQKKDRIYKTIGENPDNGLIYFLMVDDKYNLSEFSFNPTDKTIESVGIMIKNDLMMNKNKIIDILIFKKSLILINDKNELSQIYY